MYPYFNAVLFYVAWNPALTTAHSWVEKLESPYGDGKTRLGMPTKSDSVLIRYFCPFEDLNDCQADLRHGVDMFNQPEVNGDPRQPCRPGMVSNPKTAAKPGSDILIHWAGNGHVNPQSHYTCVQVKIAPFGEDPAYDDFTQIDGAECLEFYVRETGEPEGTITIPQDLEPGQYTLFWVWKFTFFWFSSCADIVVLPEEDATLVPTMSPVFQELDPNEIEDYLHNGCSDLQNPDHFCARYSGFGTQSTCEHLIKDDCGRSSCKGLDRLSMLYACPECPPNPGPPGCPAPISFYDDFSDGLDQNKWLIAHKTWNSNGGVVYDNVYLDDDAEKVVLKAHGSFYSGDVMGLKKVGGQYIRKDTGVRTGAAIVTRDYFGAGSYEVKMKIAPELGVCSAMWTFFYSEENGMPITNHEIDIELPGRPGPAHTDIGFNRALMNTFVGEIDSLSTANFTELDSYLNDGQFHVWRFDWHPDESDRRVDFYLDGNHLCTNRDHVPFYAGRFWVGAWFPENWAGEANFDTTQMEIDFVKFTPFENEVYECPPESYPEDGFAPNTVFFEAEPTSSDSDGTSSQAKCVSPTPPSTSPPVIPPTSSPPVPAPVGDDPEPYSLYLENGCNDLPSSFCGDVIGGSSYCKTWSGDDCGRFICQGHSHSMLNACAPQSAESLYRENGCVHLEDSDGFCHIFISGSSYCKSWNKDHCGRAICQGDGFSTLDAC